MFLDISVRMQKILIKNIFFKNAKKSTIIFICNNEITFITGTSINSLAC